MARFSDDVAQGSRDLAQKGAGAVFYLSTTVVSNFITTTAKDLTNVVTGGEVEVEDIILRTLNGLAGGATLKIITNNANGTSVIMQEGVAFLGSSRTMNMKTINATVIGESKANGVTNMRTVLSVPTILEEGRKVQILTSDTACTAEGTMRITFKFRRLSNDADVKLSS